MTRGLAVVAAALVLAGCGGAAKPATKAAAGQPDPLTIAARFNCTGYAPSNPAELFAASDGDCRVGGQYETILTFGSAGTQARWQAAVDAAAGGPTGTVVVGDRWAVEATNANDAAFIAQLLGAKVR